MLYLMRQGVTFEGVVILPVVGELVWFLPPENMLSVFFDIRARTITESENRVKFALRSATREKIQAYFFRESPKATCPARGTFTSSECC